MSGSYKDCFPYRASFWFGNFPFIQYEGICDIYFYFIFKGYKCFLCRAGFSRIQVWSHCPVPFSPTDRDKAAWWKGWAEVWRFVSSSTSFCAVPWGAPSIQESTWNDLLFHSARMLPNRWHCQPGMKWRESRPVCASGRQSSYSSCKNKKRGNTDLRSIFHLLLAWLIQWYLFIRKGITGKVWKAPVQHRSWTLYCRGRWQQLPQQVWRGSAWRVHISWRSGLRFSFCFKQLHAM